MTNIDEIKTIIELATYHEPSELFHEWAATTILELCERVESLRTEVEALNQQILELESGDDL